MTKEQRNDIIKSIIVLTVIALLVTAIMATVNHFTAPVSQKHAVDRANAARREIIPDAAEFQEVTDEAVISGPVSECYIGLDASGAPLGYIFTAGENGFGGTITVMCGIDCDGNIICVKTMDVSSETSTLGGKTADPAFTDQFTGADSSLTGVDTISGATITSSAYLQCVRDAFQAYELVKEGTN